MLIGIPVLAYIGYSLALAHSFSVL
jgi:hypothetical protein